MKHDVLKQFISLREALTGEKDRIEARLQQLMAILNGSHRVSVHSTIRKKGGMSAAGRARIVAAQKARWAKYNAKKKAPSKPRRKMSAAGRARIIAAQKARWARVRAAKRKG